MLTELECGVIKKKKIFVVMGEEKTNKNRALLLQISVRYDKVALMSQLVSTTSGVGHTILPKIEEMTGKCTLSPPQGSCICHHVHMQLYTIVHEDKPAGLQYLSIKMTRIESQVSTHVQYGSWIVTGTENTAQQCLLCHNT